MQLINKQTQTFTKANINAESVVNSIVSEPKKEFTSNQTKFKMCVYWSHKEDGTPYSVYEKQRRMNRKYIPSYDYTQGPNQYNITDHRAGLQKLLQKMENQKKHIEKAIIFMNDYKNGLELRIGEFPGGEFDEGKFVSPIFTPRNEKGHRYVSHLEREALQVDTMRTQNFNYKKLNNK